MIDSLEIPKQNWANFLQLLNRQALDRSVRLEVINRELGDQEMATMLPLREIDFETKGSARGALLVTVGSDGESSPTASILRRASISRTTSWAT